MRRLNKQTALTCKRYRLRFAFFIRKDMMRKCICILAVLLFSLGVCALSWADINDGLVAHYPFNGNALDESGNGNDGIVHGATLIADRYGNTDSAYHFDGVNDYIYIQYDTSLVPANYTVVVWYRADSFKVGEIIEVRGSRLRVERILKRKIIFKLLPQINHENKIS